MNFYQQYGVTYRQNKLQHLVIRMNDRLSRQLDQALLNTMFCASKLWPSLPTANTEHSHFNIVSLCY